MRRYLRLNPLRRKTQIDKNDASTSPNTPYSPEIGLGGDGVRNDEISGKMPKTALEPCLNIILGPPTDGRQRGMFTLYQQGWKEEDESKLKDWEKFERGTIDFLFHWEHDAPSTMDDLFSRLQRVPVKISGYELVTGFHGGHWVIGISIPVSRVFVAGPDGAWPPDKNICDDAGKALGYILRREWVRWYAILPSKGISESTVWLSSQGDRS